MVTERRKFYWITLLVMIQAAISGENHLQYIRQHFLYQEEAEKSCQGEASAPHRLLEKRLSNQRMLHPYQGAFGAFAQMPGS
jgi:hypothetical protein